MQRLKFTTTIPAPAAKVADKMLGLSDRSTYGQWTEVFDPTSSCEGRWEQGEKMYFTATDEQGKRMGMVTKVAEYVPNRLVSLQHIGILDGDAEITEGPMAEPWVGAMEIYTFDEEDGLTTVTVEVDTSADHVASFSEQFPQALEKLKKLCTAK